MFDIEKLTQSVAWLLSKYGGRLNCNKLVKLMYLADKEALKGACVTITKDDYCSLPKGPAAVRLCDLIIGGGASGSADRDSGQAYARSYAADSSRAKHQKEWDALFRREGDDLVALKDVPRDWISDYEIDALDAVDARFHDMSADEISEWTHNPANCPEWRDPHGGRLPITKADILRAIGRTDRQIAIILEEDAIYDEEDAIFARLSGNS